MPTVTALKTMFQPQIAPGNDAEFLRILTEADMKLLLYGRWDWTRGVDTLTPADGFITLPITYVSILGARVDKYAVPIDSIEFEYVPGGRGEVDLGVGTSRLIDQGINDAGFRYYKVAGHLDDDDVVTAIMHYAPVTLMDPDIADSSVPEDATVNTRCPDAIALKLTMLSILMEEALDLGNARSYMADALRSLDNKEQSQRGNATRTMTHKPMGRGVRPVSGYR